MVDVKRVVVVLLVVTLILSVISIVFNVVIFKVKSSDNGSGIKPNPSNSGQIGLFVEGNDYNVERDNG